jgi:hypothetical protein
MDRREFLQTSGRVGIGLVCGFAGASIYESLRSYEKTPESHPSFSVEIYGLEQLKDNPFSGHVFPEKTLRLAKEGGFLSIGINGFDEYQANVYETKNGFRRLIAKNICNATYYDDLLLPRPIGKVRYDFVITSPQFRGTRKFSYSIDFKSNLELLGLIEDACKMDPSARSDSFKEFAFMPEGRMVPESCRVHVKGDLVRYYVQGLESLADKDSTAVLERIRQEKLISHRTVN